MILELSEKLPADCTLHVKETGEKVELPASKIVVLDTCTVFPSMFPPEMRKSDVIANYIEELRPKFQKNPYLHSEQIKIEERRIKLVNAMEKGEFQKHGIYPGITNSVHGDLKFFEKIFKIKNVDRFWGNASDDRYYAIFLPVEDLRRCYKPFSEAFKENSDFSVAVASYLLGCDFASGDYTSFKQASMNMFKKAYFERWGSKKRFLRHDAESLLMRLK